MLQPGASMLAIWHQEPAYNLPRRYVLPEFDVVVHYLYPWIGWHLLWFVTKCMSSLAPMNSSALTDAIRVSLLVVDSICHISLYNRLWALCLVLTWNTHAAQLVLVVAQMHPGWRRWGGFCPDFEFSNEVRFGDGWSRGISGHFVGLVQVYK